MIRGSKSLRKWDKYIGVPLLSIAGSFPNFRRYKGSLNNVLLVIMTTIGDSVLLGRVLQAFQEKYPNTSLTCLLGSGTQAVFNLLDIKRNDVCISRDWKLLKFLAKSKFDLIFDTHQWARGTALLSCLPKSTQRIGFQTAGQKKHKAFDTSVVHSNERHEIENYHHLISHSFPFSFDYRQIYPKVIFSFPNLPSLKTPFFIFHPWAGGFNSLFRQWPNEYWAKLAKISVQEGFSVIFTGADGDKEKEQSLRSLIGNIKDIYFCAGKFSLSETLGLITKSKALVSVNTGIMHLASMVDIPIVALDGPSDYLRWGPITKRYKVLHPEKGPKRYLNLGFEYPKKPIYNMNQISVDKVWKSLLSF
jgi:heptosyltransferase-3